MFHGPSFLRDDAITLHGIAAADVLDCIDSQKCVTSNKAVTVLLHCC